MNNPILKLVIITPAGLITFITVLLQQERMATILLLLLTVLLRGSLADIGKVNIVLLIRYKIAGCYNVDQGKISVSGYSSGGFFAVQFHVAYSKSIMGSGIIAGGIN